MRRLNNCLSVANLRHTEPAHGMYPHSYVFAFNADTEVLQTFANRIDKWWKKNKFGYSDDYKLPQVMVAGPFVALTTGNVYRFDNPQEDTAKKIITIHKPPHRFAWLLMHLLTTVSMRFPTDKGLLC